MLRRNFGEDAGDLYEWKPNLLYHFEDLGSDPALYSPILLDPKTNEDNPDVGKFVELVKIVNTASDGELVARIAPYLNLKLYLRHAAVENLLSELDGIWGDTYGMNNCYLYRFDGQNLFQFLTWDKDLTFLQAERPLLQGAAENMLGRRLMTMPEYRDAYLTSLEEAARLLGGPGGWADQEIDRLYQAIREDALNDPHKQCIQPGGVIGDCAAGAFEQGVEDMHTFVRERTAYVEAQLRGCPIRQRRAIRKSPARGCWGRVGSRRWFRGRSCAWTGFIWVRR